MTEPEVKKYSLVNQPEEYELSEKFLEWRLEGYAGWREFHYKHSFLGRNNVPATITLVSPCGKEKVVLNLHNWVIKDNFPFYIFGEERANDWWHFLIVSVKDSSDEKFIIPMYPMT